MENLISYCANQLEGIGLFFDKNKNILEELEWKDKFFNYTLKKKPIIYI